MLVDIALATLSIWLAFCLRLDELVDFLSVPAVALLVSISVAIPVFVISGLYRVVFRHNSWRALSLIVRAICVYAIIFSVLISFVGLTGVPRSVGIIQPIILLLLVAASRLLVSFWLGDRYQTILKNGEHQRVFIYGAGGSGRQLAAALSNSYEMNVIGFLDDDLLLKGQSINGRKVYSPKNLEALANRKKVSLILLALPSITRSRRNEIISQINRSHLAVRTLPKLTDLAHGKISASDLRELDIDDLLGRDPVPPDLGLLQKNIYNKTVLVSGAGGSIGSEICRQVIKLKPAKLLLVDQSEFALYSIHQELGTLDVDNESLVPLLASVVDEKRMQKILESWLPDTIYHAAAYKHVPLVEHNPCEGVINNAFGTLNLAKLAAANKVKNFVLISTDKAVRPTNVMGATKRLAELMLQALAKVNPGTNFTMVRFGNVLGSSGSVVPKFRKQILSGGPITLTHLEMTRYFMTIPEAAQLVIQAGAMGDSGTVYVLDMGEPVRIFDLAKKMIELSGLTVRDSVHPDGDIEIELSGLRPGEKLYEELLIGDNPESTVHPRIMKAKEQFIEWKELENKLHVLKGLVEVNNVKNLIEVLEVLVDGYVPEGEIVDWVQSCANKKYA